jgi:hypothetical protein
VRVSSAVAAMLTARDSPGIGSFVLSVFVRFASFRREGTQNIHTLIIGGLTGIPAHR